VGERFTRADLAVASLLAPLFMPAEYGVPWPQTMPESLRDLRDRYASRVAPVAAIYARHRVPAPQ
jgi:glutathione S-transferase